MSSNDIPIGEWIERHRSALERLARHLVGADGTADDCVQETWRIAIERPPKTTDHPLAWLKSVLRSVVGDRRRRSAIRATDEYTDSIDGHAPPAETTLERWETARLVAEAVDMLGAPFREVVLLRYFEGLEPDAIARRLGIPAATVRSRLTRALNGIREVMDRRLGDRAPARTLALALLPAAKLAAVSQTAAWSFWMSGKTKAALIAGLILVVAGPLAYVAFRPDDTVQLESQSGSAANVGDARTPRRTNEANGPAAVAETTAVAGAEKKPERRIALHCVTPQGFGAEALHIVVAEPAVAANAPAADGRREELDFRTLLDSPASDGAAHAALTPDPHALRFEYANAGNDLTIDFSALGGDGVPDRIEVTIDHPLHMPDDFIVDLRRAKKHEDGAATVFEIERSLVPAMAFRGRVDAGSDAKKAVRVGLYSLRKSANGLFTFGKGDGGGISFGNSGGGGTIRLGGQGLQLSNSGGGQISGLSGLFLATNDDAGDGPVVDTGIDADGAFLIRAPRDRYPMIVAGAPGRRPAMWRGEASANTVTDIGLLSLPAGTIVEGILRTGAQPLPGIRVVCGKKKPSDGLSFTLSFVGGGEENQKPEPEETVDPVKLRLGGQVYEFDPKTLVFTCKKDASVTDAAGRFRMAGLDPGKYWISIEATASAAVDVHPVMKGRFAREIDCPQTAFDWDVAASTLTFRATPAATDADPYEVRAKIGDEQWEGTIALKKRPLLVPADEAVEVTFARQGMVDQKTAVTSAATGGTLEVAMNLERAAEKTIVLITMPGAKAKGADTLSIVFRPVPRVVGKNDEGEDIVEDRDPGPLIERRFTAQREGDDTFRYRNVHLPAGRYVMRARINESFGELVQKGVRGTNFTDIRMETDLPERGELPLKLSLPLGGRARVTVHADDGVMLQGALTLLDAKGEDVPDVSWIADRKPGYRDVEGASERDIVLMRRAVSPGTYSLRVDVDGYRQKTVPVTIEPGVETDVDVIMER